MSKIIKRLIPVIVLLALAALIAYRFLKKPEVVEEETRPTVTTEKPVRRDIVNTTEAIGTIEPQQEVDVLPKMSGTITAVNFALGDRVEEGQVLVTIHSDALDSLRIQVDAARIAMNDAQTALSRTQALFSTGAVSQQQLESAQSAAKNTKLSYESAQTQLNLQTSYTEVKAPIAGLVEMKNADEHGQANPGTAVCTISGDGGMSVSFGVTEQVLKNLKIGDKVEIEKNQNSYEGTLTEISEKVSAESGLYSCKATLSGVLSGGSALTSGSKAKLTLVSDTAKKALTVPLRAIKYADGLPYVYVLKDGTAVKTDLVTGLFDKDVIEVVSGLSDTDDVIVTWSNEIYNGAEVLVQ